MRPETAAFRELESLVRNLTEQLAGYRKRALSAEVKCRELQNEVQERRAAQDRMAAMYSEAEKARKEVEQRLAALPAPFELPDDEEAVDDPRVRQLLRENRELQGRLEQARERTTQVVERVRFLRQQLTVEK